MKTGLLLRRIQPANRRAGYHFLFRISLPLPRTILTSPTPPTRFRIDTKKIVGYLLDINHPDGGPKLRFSCHAGFLSIAFQNLLIECWTIL